MKKISYLVFLLLISACAIPHYADYQPKLGTQPKNLAKYESDRKFCLDDAVKRKNKSDPLMDSDAWKTPKQMTDECMSSKGYDVIKQSHCC